MTGFVPLLALQVVQAGVAFASAASNASEQAKVAERQAAQQAQYNKQAMAIRTQQSEAQMREARARISDNDDAATAATEKRAIEDQDRRNKLRRALASQRARFGASGISSVGGSSKALLAGLSRSSANDAAQRQKFHNLNLAGLARERGLLVKGIPLIQARNHLDEFDLRTDMETQRRKNLLEADKNKRESILGVVQQGVSFANLLGKV